MIFKVVGNIFPMVIPLQGIAVHVTMLYGTASACSGFIANCETCIAAGAFTSCITCSGDLYPTTTGTTCDGEYGLPALLPKCTYPCLSILNLYL